MELSERKKQILSILTDAYIRTGEPVGSKWIVEQFGDTISSATIRNEMAELSSLGYLDQPHTSAGRIPTAKAFRLYIDQLMRPEPLDEESCREIDAQLERATDPGSLMESASQILAEQTGCAAVTTSPMQQQAMIKKIEMIPVSSHAVAVLLMTTTGSLHTKVCRMLMPLQEEAYPQLAEMITRALSGMGLSQIGLPKIQSLIASMGEYSLKCAPIITTIYELIRESAQADVLFNGQMNLLCHPDYAPDHVHSLLGYLSERGRLAQLMQAHSGGLQVVFGNESHTPELLGTSLIVTRYEPKGSNGSIGLIGPQRMRYDIAIPTLEYVAQAVGSIFTQFMEE